MRLEDEAYGIRLLQNFESYLAGFVSVRDEVVSATDFVLIFRIYDAAGNYLTITASDRRDALQFIVAYEGRGRGPVFLADGPVPAAPRFS